MAIAAIRKWLVLLADPTGGRSPLPAPLMIGQCRRLIASAAEHGVLPTTIHNLRTLLAEDASAKRLLVPQAEAAERLRLLLVAASETLRKQAGLALGLQAYGEELQQALCRSEVPAVFIKGRDFADRLYPNPGLRTYCDIDVLVPPTAVGDAERVLESLGYRRSTADVGKYAGEYGEAAWEHARRPGVIVELHWDLVNCPSQRRSVSVGYKDLQLEAFTAAGIVRQRPTAASIILLACVHAALGHRFDRLQLICDIGQACRAAAGPIDDVWLRAAMHRTGAAVAVQTSLRITERVLHEPRCRELRLRLGVPNVGPLWNWVLDPALVIDSQTPYNRLRRQLVREWLKRAA